MSESVTFTWDPLPANYCWQSPQQFVDTLATILSGVVAGNFAGVVLGHNLPAVADQGKVWARLDDNGFLEGIYTYLGVWARPHPVPPSSNAIIIWKGSEASLWSYDGGDGSDPGSITPTLTTGAMWEKDDSFDFRLPVGIGTGGTFGSDPQTVIGVGSTGGVEKFQISMDNIPETTLGLPNTVDDNYFNSDYATGSNITSRSIGSDDSGSRPKLLTDAFGKNPPDYISKMPPYYGVIFAKRTARQFIVVTS